MNPNKDSSGQGLGVAWSEASARSRVTWRLWAFLLVPWLLDIVFRTGVLTTLLGASLWGIALLTAILLPRTRDQRLIRFLQRLSMFLAAAWALNWIWALVLGGSESAWLRPLPVTLLIKVHAALLAGGLGMVVVLWLASGAYLMQDRIVQANSWQRRGLPFRLPSLESLARVCSSSVFASLTTWGVGLALASLTTLLSDKSPGRWAWLADPQVLAATLLWLLLVGLHLARHRMGARHALIQRVDFIVSTIFLLSFAIHWTLHSSGFHEPLQWIVER